jgi:hypothetical protein
MHNPGLCGAILAVGVAVETLSPSEQSRRLIGWIDALNADTEMVLAGIAERDETLAAAVWTRAAYVVPLHSACSQADVLRALLRETLNRGRDAALIATLQAEPVSSQQVHPIVSAYRASGDEVWALLPEDAGFDASAQTRRSCYPMLLGRQMIELFLRQPDWNSAEELLSLYREHVFVIKSSEIVRASFAAQHS